MRSRSIYLVLMGALASLATPGRARAQAADPRVVKYYQGLSYQSKGPSWELAAAAGLDKETVGKSGNPDPEWIDGWITKDWSHATDNAKLALLAAWNRTWTAKCKQEHGKLRAAVKALEAKHRPEVDRLARVTNYYERIAGYGALFRALQEEISQIEGVKTKKGGVLRAAYRGYPFEVLQMIVAYRKGSSHSFFEHNVLNEASPLFGVKADRYLEDGRPLSADEGFEDQLFCLEVAKSGTSELPPLLGRDAPTQQGGVKQPPFLTAANDLRRKHEELLAAARGSIVLSPGPLIRDVQQIPVGDFKKDAPEPTLAKVQSYEVKAVKGSGEERHLELFAQESKQFDYACKTVLLQQKCKTGTLLVDYKVDLSLAELPPGQEPRKGDKITLYGELQELAMRSGKPKPGKAQDFFTIRMKARHIEALSRDGNIIFASR